MLAFTESIQVKFCTVKLLLKNTSPFLVELKNDQFMYALFIYQGHVFIMVFPTCIMTFTANPGRDLYKPL